MYTNLINVQIIISLLKQHGIRKLILSPGNRDIPLVHSVETDSDFECYSIVDERSAAYFALGMSEAAGEPVGFICTSSTASCNYMPAVREAYKKHIPLIALTADRENYYLYQFEDQKINQTDMYAPFTKYSADLPVVRNDLDRWLCIRKVNEAIINLTSGIPGPVQINFQVDRTDLFGTAELPKYRKIDNIEEKQFTGNAGQFIDKASQKKIMVIIGEYYCGSDKLKKQLDIFRSKYNAVIISDHFSNFPDTGLSSALALETMTAEDFLKYAPDLVITAGGHIWSTVKYRLRDTKKSFEHWRISDDGIIRDGFKRLRYTFNFSAERFFEIMCGCDRMLSKNTYEAMWNEKIRSIKLPDLKFSNFSVIRDVMKHVPDNSVVHCSILNSARLNSFSSYESKNVRTYCNFGCDGIDGCMSSFLGESDEDSKLSVLVIGDLSFLYDLNATFEKFSADKRILLINNHAGSEFHTAFGIKKFPSLNKHIAAGHSNDIADMIDHEKFIYLTADSQDQLDSHIKTFFSESTKPILLEVFTDANTDGEVLNSFYGINRKYTMKTQIKRGIKKVIKKLIRYE